MIWIRGPLVSVLLLTMAIGMGVEPALAAVGPCRSDLDGSGTVDSTDLTLCLGGDPACDQNGDSVVDCFDIEYVLGNFGRPCTCPGDINGDGVVDLADLSLLVARFGTTDCKADIDQNGWVEGNDVDVLQCVFGTKEPRADLNGDGGVDSQTSHRFSARSRLLRATAGPT